MSKNTDKPLVGILMGSKNDWETMQAAGKILDEFGIAYEAKVASAHRSPELVAEYSKSAEARGLEVLIGAAGLAAHLAGVIASMKCSGRARRTVGYGANAGWRARGYARDWFAWSQELSALGDSNSRQFAAGAATKAPSLSRKNGKAD